MRRPPAVVGRHHGELTGIDVGTDRRRRPSQILEPAPLPHRAGLRVR
jgi:hypothetical protein